MSLNRRVLCVAVLVALLVVGLSYSLSADVHAATSYTVYTSSAGGFEGSEILDITPDKKYAVIVGTNNTVETKLRIAIIDTANPGVKVDSLDLSTVISDLGLTQAVASSVAVYQENDSTTT